MGCRVQALWSCEGLLHLGVHTSCTIKGRGGNKYSKRGWAKININHSMNLLRPKVPHYKGGGSLPYSCPSDSTVSSKCAAVLAAKCTPVCAAFTCFLAKKTPKSVNHELKPGQCTAVYG